MKEKIKMPEDVSFILKRISDNGYEGFIVGGCVRDSLKSIKPKDWDVCTSAKPNEIIEVFKDYKIILTGLKHGTVTVVVNDTPFEITTYRIDGEYSDNRRPDNVEFTDDIVKDLSRRDFTMNAIAYNDEVGFVDPFDGVKDIYNGILRCVGSPEDRFKEDALRIMRALRFMAQLPIKGDIALQRALWQDNNVALLDNVSRERINGELCKILLSNYCSEILREHFNIVFKIIPDIKSLWEFGDLYSLVCSSMFNAGQFYNKDIVLRLALLLCDVGKPRCNTIKDSMHVSQVSAKISYRILKELRFSNEVIANTTQLISYSYIKINNNKSFVKRMLNLIGEKQFRRLIVFNDCRCFPDEVMEYEVKNTLNTLNEIIANNECYNLKMLAVNGDDLIERGIPRGKSIGNVLNILLENVINGSIDNNREDLLKKVGRIAKIYSVI